MINGIMGYKRGMTRIFDANGVAVPVTVVEAGPCTITQIKSLQNDGYMAIQMGFGETKPSRLAQAERGHLKRSGGRPLRHLREFRVDSIADLKVGTTVDCGIFETGGRVDVSGTSRGLGMSGTIKRHHFSRQRKTHGQSDRERAPGSVGAGTTPGKTFKGQRMSGRMGGERVTVRNLKVVAVDPSRNLLALNGAVPGHDGELVVIRASRA